MVILLIALMVAFHITATVFAPKNADQADERDRAIEIRAEARSGVVLGVGIVWALILLFAGNDPYWIAHALMFTLVASEIAKRRDAGHRLPGRLTPWARAAPASPIRSASSASMRAR